MNLHAVFPRRASAPIAVQILALLVGGLVAAQLVTLGIVLLVPPDRSPDYRLELIAGALRGGPLSSPGQRPLVRAVQPRAPLETGPGWVTLMRPERDLARILSVPIADVRVQFHLPLPFAGASLVRMPGGPPDGAMGPRHRRFAPLPGAAAPPPSATTSPPHSPASGPSAPEPPPSAAPPDGRDAPALDGRPWRGYGDGYASRRRAPSVGGDFIAALQTAPDRWVVVRPEPVGFPNDWQRRLLLWFAVSFIVVAPIGYLFARRLVAPLAAFAGAAEQLGRDPRAPLLTLDGPAEVGRAARAFNDMQVRLKRYVEDRTAMVGAISHDLRTPLARLRFKLERLEPDTRASMVADIAQMEAMITSVLDFIRDASEPSRRQRADLRSIIECVVDDAAMLGAEAALEPGPALTVEVDMLAIQRVLTNLVDNAVRYGGEARVSLATKAGEAVVTIADAGPGLSPEELERVFQPFYRSAPARTLDQGGVGLGLSLSRSIARAHGGEVQLRSTPDGLIAELRLPLPADVGGKSGRPRA